MAIIGRNSEIGELDQVLNSGSAEFAVVYGRRRVGKTFLVNEYFKKKSHIYLYASGVKDGDKKQQLSNFTQALLEAFSLDISLDDFSFSSWEKAFRQLTDLIAKQAKNKKIIVFLDELPWLVTPRSRLMQTLDYYWNRHWSHNNNIKLIVCGSAATWMLSHLINEEGGLYNRVSRVIKLEPFDLRITRVYLKSLGLNYNYEQVLEIYMAFGGIPHYLNFLKKGLSATQNINETCFTAGHKLRDEFPRLFRSLFENHEACEEIVRVIAQHKYGITRSALLKKLKRSEDGGRLTARLRELEASGFIKCFISESREKGQYYKVLDEYSLFYLTWIEKTKRGRLAKNYWQSIAGTAGFHTWSGYAYETICEKHLIHICHALHIPDGSIAYNWRYAAGKNKDVPGAQIDLLFDRPDKTMTICEIKNNCAPYKIDKAYAENLQQKIKVYQQKSKTVKSIQLSFITNAGLKETMYSEALVFNSMSLKDFFLQLRED
jgi:uncharacterized protein